MGEGVAVYRASRETLVGISRRLLIGLRLVLMIFLPRFTVVYSTLCKLNWLNRWRMFMKLNDGLPLYNLLGLLFGIGGSALFATPHFGSIVEALLCPYCCFLVAFSLLGAYWWAGEGRMLPGLVA